MDKDQMAKAFNEWMREFTEEPEKFEQEHQTVVRFLKEQNEGVEPSYGQTCVAKLNQYHAKLNADFA